MQVIYRDSFQVNDTWLIQFFFLIQEQLGNLAKNVPFSVFVGKLLEKSFPTSFFNTHKLKDVSEKQFDRLYGINNNNLARRFYQGDFSRFIILSYSICWSRYYK